MQPARTRRCPSAVDHPGSVVALIAVCAIGCATVTAPASRPPQPRELIVDTASRPDDDRRASASDAVAMAMVTALRSGAFDVVAGAFDQDLGTAPNAHEIAQAWSAKTAALGLMTSSQIVDRTRQDGFDTRIVLLGFERGELQCLLSLVPDTHKVASLYLAKPAPPARYVVPARFRERPVVVGAAPYLLDATLTTPLGLGPFPAVVLVHGSGPNDRDETVGANKIFKDIAEGLASAGIASVRYEKRTYRYGDQLTTALTLDAEVVDDAIAAVHLLATVPEIDAQRVFVIGHSLGGLLAPEIAVRAGRVAGVVLLAPPGRPPWDIILGQMRYLRAPAATLKAVELAITVINIGGGDGSQIVGIPFAYWRDWASRDGPAMARQLGKPVLVLHGDRDYQVLDDDLAIWRRGLAGMAAAELVTLAGDNHLFIRGSGPPGPTDYKVPSHVDDRAIARIVAFVLADRTGSTAAARR